MQTMINQIYVASITFHNGKTIVHFPLCGTNIFYSSLESFVDYVDILVRSHSEFKRSRITAILQELDVINGRPTPYKQLIKDWNNWEKESEAIGLPETYLG